MELVGSDGATHQGSYDLSYLRCIPNLVIMAPADENECRQMLYTATELGAPAIVRYPRGTGPGVALVEEMNALPLGRAELRREGRSGLALLAFGALVEPAQKVAERLDATLVNMRFVKPLDETLLIELAQTHTRFITLEEHSLAGGFGSAIVEFVNDRDLKVSVERIGVPGVLVIQNKPEKQRAIFGLSAENIAARVRAISAAVTP